MTSKPFLFAFLAAASLAGAQSPDAPVKPSGALARVASKVTNEKEARKGLDALVASDEAAVNQGSAQKAADNIDFPITMLSDDGAGEGGGTQWTRDQFLKIMSQMKADGSVKTNHKYRYDVLTDALAVVHDDATTVRGGKDKTVTHSVGMAVKQSGKWLWKVRAEGGWGSSKPKGAPHDAEP